MVIRNKDIICVLFSHCDCTIVFLLICLAHMIVYLPVMQKNKWDFFLFLVLEVSAMLVSGAVTLTSIYRTFSEFKLIFEDIVGIYFFGLIFLEIMFYWRQEF